MSKSPWVYVIFYYKGGKIVAAHAINIYTIALDRIVKDKAAEHEVIYDDYIPAFVHA